MWNLDHISGVIGGSGRVLTHFVAVVCEHQQTGQAATILIQAPLNQDKLTWRKAKKKGDFINMTYGFSSCGFALKHSNKAQDICC